MIVRTLEEAKQSERRIVSDGWESVRLLLKSDNMGFSFHITTIFAGAALDLHYQLHLESVYCVSGEGEIETTADGKVYAIKPGTIYALNQNDKHTLRATTEMTMACVFTPPLHGKEKHNADGSYALEAEAVTE